MKALDMEEPLASPEPKVQTSFTKLQPVRNSSSSYAFTLVMEMCQAPEPKRLQSWILKLVIASLKTSAIGRHPACTAGMARPALTVLALSLNGLKSQIHNLALSEAINRYHPFNGW